VTLRRKLELGALAALFAVALFPALSTLSGWFDYRGVWLLRVDYSLYANSALQGLHQGWHNLHDIPAQQRAHQEMPGLWWFSNVYTPALSVFMIPFAFLPLGAGYAIWCALLFACMLLAFWLLAPGDWTARTAQLPMLFATHPVALGLWLGQIIPLQMAALALAWIALRRGREATAGALLSVIALKPQGMLLVPFALLAAGRKKLFASWALCMAAIGLGTLALIGVDGALAYLHRIAYAQTHLEEYAVAWSYSLARRWGNGPSLWLIELAAIAATLVAAFRHRDKPELAIAAGLAGSLVASPFIHLQDFMLLFPAGWLLLRAVPGPLTAGALLLGYAAMEVSADDHIGGRWVLLFTCLLVPALAALPPPRLQAAVE
jgi:alpha-1,2-mannosyltransferase